MSASSFDTLEYLQELKKSGMNEVEAEAITKATAKAFTHVLDLKEIATKTDFKQLEAVLKKEMSDNKLELIRYTTETKIELSKNLNDTKIELTKNLSDTKTELIKYIQDTKLELTKNFNDTKIELIKYTHDTMWKMIGAMAGIMTLFGVVQHYFK